MSEAEAIAIARDDAVYYATKLNGASAAVNADGCAAASR
jgi:hypothetical protein